MSKMTNLEDKYRILDGNIMFGRIQAQRVVYWGSELTWMIQTGVDAVMDMVQECNNARP
jgi:hypothetical protein